MGLEHDFPVPENALPRLHVPPQRLDEWKQVAQDEIMRAISNPHSWYNAFKDRVGEGFDLLADKPNLKAFVRPVPNTADKDILIRASLEGVTLDDLVAGLYCETTYDARTTFAHMYEANFLDAGILQVHETRMEQDPFHFVGMRWTAFRSPAPSIVTSREFLFFSYEGTAYDVDGSRVLFRFLRTMPMEDIEVNSEHMPPLVRGKISNLHLYRQNGSRVESYTKAMHSNAGNMPSWIVTKTISFMFPGIANVETVAHARALLQVGTAKLNPNRVLPSQSSASRGSAHSMYMLHSPSLAAANACSVCFHKFALTRSKRRCQGCYREVCKRCTRRMFFFDELKQVSDTGVVALRFCLNCTRLAHSEARELNASSQRASLRRQSSGSSGSSRSSRRKLSHHSASQPEGEPHCEYQSNYSYQDSSDDGSVSYDAYQHGMHTPTGKHGHTSKLVSIDNLARQQSNQRNHLLSPQTSSSAPTSYPMPPSPQPFHSRSLGDHNPSPLYRPHHRTPVPSPVPRHMIPPIPSPDVPTRQKSPRPVRTPRSAGPVDEPMSEDLEKIFRLRMMLFDGAEGETETVSSTSTSNGHVRHHGIARGEPQSVHVRQRY